MDSSANNPKWQIELETFKGIKSTFIIEENIHDIYPLISENKTKYLDLNGIVEGIFNRGNTEGYYDFLFCNPLFGFFDPFQHGNMDDLLSASERALKEFNNENHVFESKCNSQNLEPKQKMVYYSELIRSALTNRLESKNGQTKSVVVVVNFASRYLSTPDGLSENEIQFFLNLLYGCNNAKRPYKYINTLVLVVDKFNDIPAWMYINNPNTRMITIPNPDRSVRSDFINSKYFASEGSENIILEKYIDLSDGMKLNELREVRELEHSYGEKAPSPSEIMSVYKYGFKDDKWNQIRKKLYDIENEGNGIKCELEKSVKGQNRAVESAVSVLERAVVGLSGLQHSSDSKPKGILFLAGPTGTGKTELVKSISRLLFSDEKTVVRFDMSEYGEENADQRLFGAPPGYVGYDRGGQLTNAVRANPFCILLFDEIEKAHPNIMDKFLQILEDGRMTDGQGKTVYFSETLIVFTSNIGISKEIFDVDGNKIRQILVKPGDKYADIYESVWKSFNEIFKPEIVNRIGKHNVVVFDFISDAVAKDILIAKIESINSTISTKYRIKILASDDVREWLYKKCCTDEVRSMGGRGIGSILEEYYINELSHTIFVNDIFENAVIKVGVKDNELSVTVG